MNLAKIKLELTQHLFSTLITNNTKLGIIIILKAHGDLFKSDIHKLLNKSDIHKLLNESGIQISYKNTHVAIQQLINQGLLNHKTIKEKNNSTYISINNKKVTKEIKTMKESFDFLSKIFITS